MTPQRLPHQPALIIFASHRYILGFGNVFVCNQTDQVIGSTTTGSFSIFVFLQDLRGSAKVCLLVSGHQVLALSSPRRRFLSNRRSKRRSRLCHDSTKWFSSSTTECHRYDSRGIISKASLTVATPTGLSPGHISYRSRTLHNCNLSCLLLNGMFFVNHAYAASPSNGDGHRTSVTYPIAAVTNGTFSSM